ncbi:biogenesis of lysosome-related organelles complex 1 subunit 1-like [Panonychus citri]|uniref:biogenesis of lysosome-related organelles complex 1 subunit 1-like n=1 Tax=Panonychus citri TaxID=50023 RepID=UPI002308272B|nr:biogenesis of lysosome-related organelles complex 1 subunit 1-like [Panonychus citri]
MLSSMLKEHQCKQQERKEEIEKQKTEASDSVVELTHHMVDHLNDGVAQAYLNQRKLDAETKQLHANVTQFSKQANQWLTVMQSLNKSVKELGDVENWSKSIENDLRLVSSALEYVYKVGPQSKS